MSRFPRTRTLAIVLLAFASLLAPVLHETASASPPAHRHRMRLARARAAAAARDSAAARERRDAEMHANAPSQTTDDAVARDTLDFTPIPSDTDTLRVDWVKDQDDDERWWRHRHERHTRALLPHSPYGDGILTDDDQWRVVSGRFEDWPQPIGDYNRVDRLALGLGYQLHPDDTMAPRFGARWAYSFGRKRPMYGVELEQPLLGSGLLAFGGSMYRWTAHPDLQQTGGIENSLDLLFGRNDNRDYFEREGFGAHVSSRLGDATTASVHVSNDRYRSLVASGGVTSIFWRERVLRANPAIDDGEAHAFSIRLERLAQRVSRPSAGFYHYVAYERAGGPTLKGDFDYTRVLADVRTVVRLSPATSVGLRAVGGSTRDGTLPLQRAFTLGGFDGLRAHPTASLAGDQVALGQLEYDVDLWRLVPQEMFGGGGIHLIAFVDAGQAWSSPSHAWDLDRQRVAADGGFGVAGGDDEFRVYFARNLQRPDSGFVVSARLERPF